MSEPTIGELERRLSVLENSIRTNTVNKEAYAERQKFIDNEFETAEEWHERHEGSHTWFFRLLIGTALSTLVTILLILLDLARST